MGNFKAVAQFAPVYAAVNFGGNSSIGNMRFFAVDSDCIVDRVVISHVIAGTDVGAVTLRVRKLTGTQAVSAGVDVLAADYNLKGAINTPTVVALTATASNKLLAEGDNLAVQFVGTTTAVAGVSVTVRLRRITKIQN